MEAVDCAVHGSTLAEHVPNYRKIGTEDTAEGFEDGVRAEGDIVPGEVCTATTEDDGESNGRYDAGSVINLVSSAMRWTKMVNLRKSNAEDETKKQLLLCLQLQMPYHGYWH
jgi:hypothetical protein